MEERLTEPGLAEQYWRRQERRRSVASIAGAVLVLSLLAGALARSAVLPPPRSPEVWPRRTVIGGIDVDATPSVEPSGSVAPTGTPTGEGSQAHEDGGPASWVRARAIAYRRDGLVCVADESGAGERTLAHSAAGRFALSPDGSTLALIDAVAKTLALVPASGGATVTVGPALSAPPAWAPDSSWLAYTAPGPSVRRVDADGSDDLELLSGRFPVVSLDGRYVVAAAEEASGGGVLVWHEGAVVRLPTAAVLSGLACDGKTVFYATVSSSDSTASLRAVALDGTNDRVLVSVPAMPRVSGFRDLVLSPDGRWLAYAEYGDDEYSRVFVVPTAGGVPTALSLRRDCYPLGWSADGSRLFLVEGNAYQGEPTSLVEVRPDGSGRRLVREGAAR